tara:strand:- start:5003 stop:7939 length:2937 start_codon:yes stop_codon:yes gene_type:complete
MRPLDRRALGGDLILQDFRDIPPEDTHLRATIGVCRVVDRGPTGDWEVEGHGESESDVKTIGDLRSAFHVPTERPDLRGTGSWFFAGAVTLAEASKRPRKEEAGQTGVFARALHSQTRGAAPDEGPRKARVRLVRNESWDEDERYQEDFSASIHPLSPDLPKGSLGVLLAGTEERSQEMLFLPISPGGLRSVVRGPDQDASSIVYDTNALGEDDERWNAPLHKFWRVSRLKARCDGAPATAALAWQLTNPTRGLVVDSPFARSTAPKEVASADLDPSSPPTADGGFASGNYGGVYTIDQIVAQQEETARQIAAQGGQSGTYGGITVLGRTQTRPPASQSSKGGQVTTIADLKRPTTATDATLVYALASAHAGGPFDVGEAADIHRVGLDEDGNPINALHLSTRALFRGGGGDGPLYFEGGQQEAATGYGGRAPVHLRWNPNRSHIGPCGETLRGAWDWVAEVPFFVPEDREPPPPGGDKIIIGNPPWPPFPPQPPQPPWGPPGSPPPGGGPPGGGGGPAECKTLPGPQPGGADGTGGITTGPLSPTGVGLGGFLGGGVGGAVTGPNAGGTITDAFGGSLLGNPDPFTGGLGDTFLPGGSNYGGIGDLLNGGTTFGPPPNAGSAAGGGRHPGGGGARGAQKRGDRFAGLAALAGVPMGAIGAGGTVMVSEAARAQLIATGVMDGSGRLVGMEPRINDSPGQRQTLLGGPLTRTPTTQSALSVAGGLQIKAQPWAAGEVDPAAGGFISEDTERQLSLSPTAAAHVGLASGDGTLAGFKSTQRFGGSPIAASPATMKVRGELGTGDGLAAILRGDYATGGRLAGTVTPLTDFFPEGVSRQFFGDPTPEGSSLLGSGVLMEAGSSGAFSLQSYTSGAEAAGSLEMTAAGGNLVGTWNYNGSEISTGSGGGTNFGIGGSGEDGDLTISSDTSYSAVISADDWTHNAGNSVYPGVNLPLVRKASGNAVFNGTVTVEGRCYIYPS